MFSSVILGISFLLEASFLGIGIRKLLRMMNKTLQHGRGDRAASGSVQHKPIVFQNEKEGAVSGKDPSGPRRRRRRVSLSVSSSRGSSAAGISRGRGHSRRAARSQSAAAARLSAARAQ